MSNTETIKMYLLNVTEGVEPINLKYIAYHQYHKRPLRVLIPGRPAVFKFVQKVKYMPKGLAIEKELDIEGYFIRINVDEYRQVTPKETEQLFAWMANHEVKPDDLSLEQVDTALAMPVIEQPPRTMIDAYDDEKTPGGIILP